MKKLSKLFNNFPLQSGFTMIELLVVIAIIGILAVAVLSSLNPIEQINKGRDTRLRSNAAQLINAVDRFYAIQEIYPWNDATYTGLAADTLPTTVFPDTFNCTASTTPAGFCQVGGIGYSALTPWLTALETTDEVKAAYIDTLEETSASNALYLYKAVSTNPTIPDDLIICFLPSSKQFQQDALDSCISRDTSQPDDACPQTPYAGTETWADEMICLP